MQWISAIAGWFEIRPPRRGDESFARRERELQERLNRLEREVEVIQRAEADEDGRR